MTVSAKYISITKITRIPRTSQLKVRVGERNDSRNDSSVKCIHRAALLLLSTKPRRSEHIKISSDTWSSDFPRNRKILLPYFPLPTVPNGKLNSYFQKSRTIFPRQGREERGGATTQCEGEGKKKEKAVWAESRPNGLDIERNSSGNVRSGTLWMGSYLRWWAGPCSWWDWQKIEWWRSAIVFWWCGAEFDSWPSCTGCSRDWANPTHLTRSSSLSVGWRGYRGWLSQSRTRSWPWRLWYRRVVGRASRSRILRPAVVRDQEWIWNGDGGTPVNSRIQPHDLENVTSWTRFEFLLAVVRS